MVRWAWYQSWFHPVWVPVWNTAPQSTRRTQSQCNNLFVAFIVNALYTDTNLFCTHSAIPLLTHCDREAARPPRQTLRQTARGCSAMRAAASYSGGGGGGSAMAIKIYNLCNFRATEDTECTEHCVFLCVSPRTLRLILK